MKRRGVSLGEALISLALFLVVLTAITAVARDVMRSQRFSAQKDRSMALELRLLEVARECAQAREWLEPLRNPGSTGQRLRFRKVNPRLNQEPPGGSDRLPATVPLPPLASWDGFAPAWLDEVDYQCSGGQLLRCGQPLAPLEADFRVTHLADGRLQIDYAYRDDQSALVRRTVYAFPVLL